MGRLPYRPASSCRAGLEVTDISIGAIVMRPQPAIVSVIVDIGR